MCNFNGTSNICSTSGIVLILLFSHVSLVRGVWYMLYIRCILRNVLRWCLVFTIYALTYVYSYSWAYKLCLLMFWQLMCSCSCFMLQLSLLMFNYIQSVYVILFIIYLHVTLAFIFAINYGHNYDICSQHYVCALWCMTH